MGRFIEFIPYVDNTFTTGTTTGTSQLNTCRSDAPEVVIIVTVANAPTGTTPTLALALMTSMDNVNFALAYTTTPTLTAAGTARFVTPQNIYEPYIRLDAVVTGTTASFTGVTAYMLTSGSESS